MSTSAEYVGLGPCVQDPAWVKMSSSTTALHKKKRKPDGKPQSQINKCLNEKRRREQENTYIEELAELIQASIVSDMNSLSVKPDKCAILQQTVDKIKQIKESEASDGAVQQGEVSSSRQTLLQNQLIGPLVLEALDGFLFLVSPEEKIAFVSENVSQYIKFSPEDLSGKLIYNIIHVGDHSKFSPPFMSVGWSSESSSECTRSRNFTCRLLIKPSEEEGEQEPLVPQYERMQIYAVLSSNYLGEKGDAEEVAEGESQQQYLVCIARRIPTNEPQGTPVELFTTKLDRIGKILDIDTSGVSSTYSQYLTKDLVRQHFIDLCHPSDGEKFSSLLHEAQSSGHSTSQVYRLKFGLDRCIHIQTKCKYFHNLNEESFILATHSIISSFQEASCSSNSLTGISIMDENLRSSGRDNASTPTSDSSRQLRLLLTQVSESDSDVGGSSVESEVGQTCSQQSQSQQQQNKTLKDLLDQKDEEETSSSPNSFLNQYCPPSTLVDQQPQPAHTSHQETTSKNNASNRNNRLIKLLNDKRDDEDEDNDDLKKEDDDFFGMLEEEVKDESITVKPDFRSSKSVPLSSPEASPSPLSSNHPSFSLPNTTTSSTSFSYCISGSGTPRPPSRPSSTDLQGTVRGMKRPSDELHDGNPSKQAVGGFESLLIASPTSVSPSSVPIGGPSTPLARSTTPHGRPNTPLGGPGTPLGRPTTPHGGPTTPHGPLTPLGVGSGHMVQMNAQGMAGNLPPLTSHGMNNSIASNLSQQQQHMQQLQQQHYQQQQFPSQQQHQQFQLQNIAKPEKNKMLLKLLSNPAQQPPTGTLKPLTSPYSLPQEKLPKNLTEKLPRPWTTSTTATSMTSSSNSNAHPEILNQLLTQPPSNIRPSTKMNTIGPNQLIRSTSHPGPEMMGQQAGMQQQYHHLQQQQSMQLQHQHKMESVISHLQQPQSIGIGVSPLSSMSTNMTGGITGSPMSGGGGASNDQYTVMSRNDGSINTLSSISSSTSLTSSTALPPFSHSMGLNLLGPVTSTSYPDGPLPSITTATSSFSQNSLNNDFHDIEAIEILLDLEMSGGGESGGGLNSLLEDFNNVPTSSSSSSPFDINENFAIQQIKNKLMSEEFETQTNPAVSTSMMSYGGIAQSTSMNSYPPPYVQRNRYPSSNAGIPGVNMLGSPTSSGLIGNPSSGSVGNSVVMRHPSPQFSPGSPVMQQARVLSGQQRFSQLTPQQQEQMKVRLLHRQQQQQLLVASSSSDSTQSSPSYQNFDELINSSVVAPNVNVALQQRNSMDSQQSPNYGMTNSPLGSVPGGQVSPGQRIPQPPFSPHGQIGSPLPNMQQFSNSSGQMSAYQNNQNSQLSPRLSQGSPVPPNYSGGAMLSQMSPTGPGQQSSAWSGSSPQHRTSLQQQNAMINPQIGMMGGANRTFSVSGGGRSMQLPSIRSLPNPGAHQTTYSLGGPHSVGNHDMTTYQNAPPQQGPSQLMYQQVQQQPQQSQQQYRLSRTISAPSQMPGVHPPRSAHFPIHPHHHHHPHNASHQVMGGGQYSPHLSPSSMGSPHMGQLGGPMDGGQSMMGMGNQHMMGGNATGSGLVGGVMGNQGFGDIPGQSHNFDGSSNCFVTSERNPPGGTGMINDRTRNELRARVEARNTAIGSGTQSPAMHQQQQILQQRPPLPHPSGQPQPNQQLIPPRQQQQQHQGPQQHTAYQQPLDHQRPHPLDQPLHTFSPSGDGSTWSHDTMCGTSQGSSTTPGALTPSPLMDDGRGSTSGGGAEKEKSMLKKLLSQ